MINTWVNTITKPKETFAAEKGNASMGKAAVNYIIAGVISGVIAFLATLIGLSQTGSATTTAIGAGLGALGIIVSPIVTLIGAFIGVGIIWIFAKILGGKGTYTQLFFLVSLFAIPMAVIGLVIVIPAVGSILGLLVGLYTLYLWVIAVQSSQELSTGRAVAAVLIPVILIAIIIAILAVIGLMALGTAMGGLPGYTG